MKEGGRRRWRRGGGDINFDNKQHTCTQHYRVRDCNVNLPDGPSCILGIPECGVSGSTLRARDLTLTSFPTCKVEEVDALLSL